MKKLWAAWPFWLKLTLAAAIVFVASAAGAWWTDDRSSFPNWLQGIGTLAALLAAIVAARHAAGAFGLERDREERWTSQQRAAQASLIAAWPGQMSGNYAKTDGIWDGDPTDISTVDVYLRNASDVPVTRVWVDATLVVDIRSDSPIRLHMASREIARVLQPTSEPSRMHLEAETPVDLQKYRPGNVKIDYWCEISVSFRDAGGRDWQRIPDGQLLLVQDANAHD